MLIQRILNKRGDSAPFLISASMAARLAIVSILTGLLVGCGGGSSSANNKVAQVVVNPTTISLVAGQVVSLSTSAVNSANVGVSTTFTFNSSNTAVATVSPSGLVCGGVWDSTFVVCNGNDAQGNPITGSATLTATAQGVSSGPVSVSVHPSITSVSVEQVSGTSCFSSGETHQFVAHALHNGIDITGSVGAITWTTSDATVATVDANGLATARVGGLGGVVASVGSTTSPAVPFKTCMPVDIILHVAGDPAGNFTFSTIMNVTDTKIMQVDVIDEKGAISAATQTLTITSNNTAIATMGGTTVTAQSPGGAGLQAACVPPSCGNGINAPVYSNVFNITVSGNSPNTITVYAASSFPPPTGQIMPLIPIDASQTPPVAKPALGLPGVPNSMVFDRGGDKVYIGTNVGLVSLTTGGSALNVVAPAALGKILAVSADGNSVIVSNAADDPATGLPIEPNAANQRVWIFNSSANTLTTFISPGAVAATFDDDGFRAYIVANNGNVYVFSPLLTFVTNNIGGSSLSAATLPSGPFAYVVNSAGLKVIATCNNTVQASPPTNTTSGLQLVGVPRNQDQVFVMDSTGIDQETVTVTPLATPVNFTAANCAPNVSYSNQFFDFGLGPIVANQLLVATNGLHVAVLPKGRGAVLTLIPSQTIGIAALAGGANTEALSGGLTPDGATLWVGVAGSNTVDRINMLDNQDEIQIPMSFVKADGSPAPPNLVAVQPK